MTTLQKGANAVLTSASAARVGPLVVGVDWVNEAADLDVVALVCDGAKRVLGDTHFLFWDQTATPAKDVLLLSVPPGETSPTDRSQVILNLDAVEDAVGRIYIALATIADGVTLAQSGGVSVRIIDGLDGAMLDSYSNSGNYSTETCLTLVELYRYQQKWKVRAVDQGYAGGLAAFGRDHGVDIA